ncbi:hypothetical protein BV22DRAFT_1133221 [Leucogyrophana mollusca]|uniref:Uncharacterized protein n=1 Tax=Leucogyrophana mollusca TaxID=85980 RepID=A0ACB8B4V7_9AGAM|nr:hypothetical protein BV22DRAFT_1133221 [Leucogyrophana mollusca]
MQLAFASIAALVVFVASVHALPAQEQRGVHYIATWDESGVEDSTVEKREPHGTDLRALLTTQKYIVSYKSEVEDSVA